MFDKRRTSCSAKQPLSLSRSRSLAAPSGIAKMMNIGGAKVKKEEIADDRYIKQRLKAGTFKTNVHAADPA